MERVAFLIDDTNTTIRCLLNPESVVVRRHAGVEERRSRTGRLSGTNLPDTPLIYTGGGRTELELDLLFDTSLLDGEMRPGDVRKLTEPIWNLAENRGVSAQYGAPPRVRFLWGKAWNVPGVVISVAERLEQFTSSGAPQRSWLRMRLLRVSDPRSEGAGEPMEIEGSTDSASYLMNGVAAPEESAADYVPDETDDALDDGPSFAPFDDLPDFDFPDWPDREDDDGGEDSGQPDEEDSDEVESDSQDDEERP